MMASVAKLGPELVQAMPRIMEKVKTATAGLPPPVQHSPAK
jgi:hypothetical protein